jgi:prophage regulatory protein
MSNTIQYSPKYRIVRAKRLPSWTGNAISTNYLHAKIGLLTRSVRTSEGSSGWPEHEVDAIVRARIAEWSDDQIRKLVLKLEADRPKLAPYVEAGLEISEIEKTMASAIRVEKPP